MLSLMDRLIANENKYNLEQFKLQIEAQHKHQVELAKIQLSEYIKQTQEEI